MTTYIHAWMHSSALSALSLRGAGAGLERHLVRSVHISGLLPGRYLISSSAGWKTYDGIV